VVFFKQNLIETRGLMSSEKISSEIYKRFNRKLSSGLIRRYRRKFGRSFNLTLITLNKLDLLIIITFLILAGYVYRRLRKSPYLTDYNKLLRLEWCLKHRNTDFSKFIFVDETTIRLWDLPLYHWRLRGSRPDDIPCTSKFRDKVNICGGISFKGTTEFKVCHVI